MLVAPFLGPFRKPNGHLLILLLFLSFCLSEAFSGGVNESAVDYERGTLPEISKGIYQQQRIEEFLNERVCSVY